MKNILRILIVLFGGMGICGGTGMILIENNLLGIFFIILNLFLIAFVFIVTERIYGT